MKIITVQGREVIIRGNRCFAAPRELSLTDRIASMSQAPGQWDRQMTKPMIRVRNTRSIRG